MRSLLVSRIVVKVVLVAMLSCSLLMKAVWPASQSALSASTYWVGICVECGAIACLVLRYEALGAVLCVGLAVGGIVASLVLKGHCGCLGQLVLTPRQHFTVSAFVGAIAALHGIINARSTST